VSLSPAVLAAPPPQVLFEDGFEKGLGSWLVGDSAAIRIMDPGDPTHGRVLHMGPSSARLAAMIRGSERWGAYRIETDFRFPSNEHNYLGFIYNLQEAAGRVDLGSIYVKGNGSYLQVNPRRDWNPMRTVYPEYHVALEDDAAIRIGQWHRFAAEVVDNICHVYIDDMERPKLTFDLLDLDAGAVGFKPRVVGGPVWIDNVRAVPITELSYKGPAIPEFPYRRDRMVTKWWVLPRLTRSFPDMERFIDPTTRAVDDRGVMNRWQLLPADPRGGVVTARHVDFLGDRTVAYFATTIEVPEGDRQILEISSADDLALWRNGTFVGYDSRDPYAWYDFGDNPDHPRSMGLPLLEGTNHVLVRVRGGIYATGGFFARVSPAPGEASGPGS
jgi:hypothetical protein